MAFKLESNPLEGNALFSAPEKEPAPKSSKAQKKPASAPKAKAEKKTAAPAPVPAVDPDSDEYIRATFIVRKDLLRRLKDYAYTDRREIKGVINDILEQALSKIEADYAKRGEKLLHMEGDRGLPASGSRK